MKLNRDAFTYAKKLIKRGKYVLDSDWSESQPSADEENQYLKKHGWDDYGNWFLGIDTDESSQTKGHFKFPYGDFKKVHRDGVIAAKQRAAQNGYREVEKVAGEMLDMIDECEYERS